LADSTTTTLGCGPVQNQLRPGHGLGLFDEGEPINLQRLTGIVPDGILTELEGQVRDPRQINPWLGKKNETKE
jgi:hypothetical protein